MTPTPDELAGIADLFGALTREELAEAVENVAARTGETFDPGEIDAAISAACEEYYLIDVDGLLAPGPAALPTLPEHGADLPHMMSIEARTIDRETVARAAEESLRAEAAQAVAAEDGDRARELLDVCYEIDSWGPTDLSDVRERLDELVA